MKFGIILLCIYLTLYKFNNTGITITYSDAILIVVIPMFINDIFKGRIRLNKFGKLFFSYNILLLFSGLSNQTFLEGAFLNIFRTGLVSWLLYTWSYSLVINKEIKQKYYFILMLALAILFLIKTWPEMQSAWTSSEEGFTNVNIFENSLNLNTWGFTVLLFFIVAGYSWSLRHQQLLSAIIMLTLSTFVLFSFSRAAWALLFISAVWILFYVNKLKVSRIVQLLLLGMLILILNSHFKLINFEFSDTAIEFIGKKLSDFEDNFINVRLFLINILPIEESIQRFNLFQIFFGDGISIQHSWFSHTFLVTGIVGFFVFVRRFFVGFLEGAKSLAYSKVSGKFVILILMLLMVNDFISNISSFLPFSAYLSSVIVAIFFAETRKVRFVHGT